MKDGTWMMKMSATAYFLSFVIKNQFAVDCRFCSQNFSFYTSTKTKYAQVMSKLWLSKNRTQHSNQIVWFSIGMQEKKRRRREKWQRQCINNVMAGVTHFFICGSIDIFMNHTMSSDLCLQRFILLLFILTSFVVCTFVCSRLVYLIHHYFCTY